MSRNERDRKTEAFMICFGAVSIPFGAVLGALLSDVGKKYLNFQPDLSVAQAGLLYVCIVAVCAFYIIIPVVCIAIIRQWRPGFGWIGIAILLIIITAVMMPTSSLGMPIRMWLTITAAWITTCLALSFICRGMIVRESFLK